MADLHGRADRCAGARGAGGGRSGGRERRTAQADLRLEVTRAVWALVTARASLDVLEQGVARSQAHGRREPALHRGLVPPNEVSSASAQEARARMLAIEARSSATSPAPSWLV